MEKNERQLFVEWLDANGAEWHNLNIEYLDKFGYAGVANGTIAAGETVIRLPYSLIISAERVRFDPKCGAAFSATEKLLLSQSVDLTPVDISRAISYVFLAHQRTLGSKSFWYPYIHLLPEQFDNALWYPKNSVETLKGSPLYDRIKAAEYLLQAVYKKFVTPLLEVYPELFDKKAMNYECIRWAHSCFFSRALRVPGRAGTTEEALTPLVDILNHRPGAIMEFVRTCRRDVASDKTISKQYYVDLVCGRQINQSEQIFINYGAKDNGLLLLYYGFVFDDNPMDYVRIDFSRVIQQLPSDSLHRKNENVFFEHDLTRWGTAGALLDFARSLHIKDQSKYTEWINKKDSPNDGNMRLNELYGEEAGHCASIMDGFSDMYSDKINKEPLFNWNEIGYPWTFESEMMALNFLDNALKTYRLSIRDVQYEVAQNKDYKSTVRTSNLQLYLKGLQDIIMRYAKIITELQSCLIKRNNGHHQL